MISLVDLLRQKEIQQVIEATKECEGLHFVHNGTAVYSAWKQPDAVSSPQSIMTGRPSSIGLCPPEIARLPISAKLEAYPLLPEIESPYKRKNLPHQANLSL